MPHLTAPPVNAVEQLADTQLFSDLDIQQLETLVKVADWLTLAPGETLFQFGEAGDSGCVLLQGRLEVRLPSGSGGGERIAGPVLPGESVGELALLTGALRSATVTAIRHSHLVRLSRERFLELARLAPEFAIRVSQVIGERQARPERARLARIPRVVGVLGWPEARPVFVLVSELVACLGGEAVLLDHAAALSALGGEDALADLPRVAAWVAGVEQSCGLVFLQSQPGQSSWNRACAMLADTVLLVADAQLTPRPRSSLHGGSTVQPTELVLRHPSSTSTPHGTRRWLDLGPFSAHHHMREGHRGDLERLARRLTGKSVGLALGGGAARGIAHLGALRALRELNLTIDLVCGTSFGSVIGGLCARDLPMEEIEAAMDRYFSDYWIIRPTALPLLSALSGAPLEKMCDELFGGVDVEDCWKPYFAAASNLTDARVAVMDSGPMSFAVRASGSVPGMWPPVFRDDKVYVDGVMTNNLPGDLLGIRHTGSTIAINLIPAKDPLFTASSVPHSRRRALLSRINPFQRKPLPLLPDLALRSLFMSTIHQAERVRDQVELFIEPDVGGFGFVFEAANRERIVDAGYRATLQAVRAWQEGATP